MKIFMGENRSCVLNYQDSVIYGYLKTLYQMVDDPSEADVLVFAGTCCCSARVLKNTMKYIHDNVQKKRPEAKVYMSGCLTREFYDEELNEMVRQFIKNHIDVVVPQNKPMQLIEEISKIEFSILEQFGHYIPDVRGKDHLFISNGCQNRCAFCKTTFQHYPLTSAPFDVVREHIDQSDKNHTETIWIFGTNLCQYGLDTEGVHLLPELIRYLETKKHIQHVAFIGYAFKDAIRHGFLEAFPTSKKHYTLSGSLESGSNRILELMQKGFTKEEILVFMKGMREKANVDIITSIIAGFPTETIKDVQETLDVVKKLQPRNLEICRYMDSPFVASHTLEQLSEEEKDNHVRIYDSVLTKSKIKHHANW